MREGETIQDVSAFFGADFSPGSVFRLIASTGASILVGGA
jgi:hypothetical protein